jgi:hypoxanthine phosphoribosyltransferase
MLDLSEDINGKNVLIVEDIVDTCLTMEYLIRILKARNPKSIRVCSLLRKDNAKINVKVDYIGFNINKKAFVIGYGLDLAEKYRHLPNIHIFEPKK